MALATLSKEEKVCLMGLVALSLQPNDQALGQFNVHLLQRLPGLLGLEDHHWLALQPLLHSEGNDLAIRQAQLQAFLKPFMTAPAPTEHEDAVGRAAAVERWKRRRYLIIRDLLINLACMSMYDARTRRVMVRLALDCLDVSWHDVARIEALAASHLHDIWEASHAKDKVHKGFRMAKITAAALGGGALMALTGGLAAPAIGVGLSALSATGAMVAGFTSTASVATLFGASGAGLVGYKMKRRTAALDQFEFRHVERGEEDEESDLGRMAICICISGWLLNDESEYDTPFGVEPRNSDVAARLRLFYSRHNPENVKYASILAAEFKGREDALERECLRKYGASPFDSWSSSAAAAGGGSGSSHEGTAPAASLYKDVSEAEKEEVFHLIAWYDDENAASSTVDAAAARKARLTKKKSTTSSREEDGELAAEVRRIVGLQLTSPPPPRPAARQPAPARAAGESTETHDEDAEGQCRRHEDGDVTRSDEVDRLDSETETLLELVAEDSSEIVAPWWLGTFPFLETFTLRWESKALFALGTSVMEIVASLGQQAALEVLTFTAAATLVSALAWPITLLQAADMIDSTWTMACEKADRAGQLLAQVLMKKEHGHRPVVLVGFSMGARVIMSCLLELAKVHKAWEADELKRKEQVAITASFASSSSSAASAASSASLPTTAASLGSPASGLVHTVVLMGAPVPCSEASWCKARGIVADRLVNCYSKKDWVLSLMYRYSKFTTNAAGIAEIKVAGVENVDVTELVPGHQLYANKIKEVLTLVGLDDSFATAAPGAFAGKEAAMARRREADSEIVAASGAVNLTEEEEEEEAAVDEDESGTRQVRRTSWSDGAHTILY